MPGHVLCHCTVHQGSTMPLLLKKDKATVHNQVEISALPQYERRLFGRNAAQLQ